MSLGNNNSMSSDKLSSINNDAFIRIEAEIKEAFKKNEFKTYLQPKINMITSKIVGAEALSRWIHPTEGIKMPNLYTPIMEDNGNVSTLDFMVFEDVCNIKASWKGTECEHLPISVNMSRLHLFDIHFPDKLAYIANKHDIPKSELEIELSESIFDDNANAMLDAITAIQNRGFLVSIDKFGHGIPSFDILRSLNVSSIKLDKDVIDSVVNDQRGRIVLKSIINLCKDLKMNVVAEGIETKEQVEILTHYGCTIAQGFYYSIATPANLFTKYAHQHLGIPNSTYAFTFNKTIECDNKIITSNYVGNSPITYTEGVIKDTYAISFNGGSIEQNVVEISRDVITSESYAISFWIRPRKNHMWASALYLKFATGFASFNPLAWEGHSNYRIRDSREIEGWYDASSCQLQENIWWHVTVSYNAESETSILYINGSPISILQNIPVNCYIKKVLVGGDIFQPSFIGDICNLVFYNEAKDQDFVKTQYLGYINNPDFIGGEQKSLI